MTRPCLSVLSVNKNLGRYLAETIDSVRQQSFREYEHILVDGASTDGSVEMLRDWPHLRWISELDSDANDAFDKAIQMAEGDYLTFCPVSDGYLSRNWFSRCIKILEEEPEVALVWGADALMTHDGDLFGLAFPQFHRRKPPSGKGFLPYWLATHLWFPEQNYIIRRSVIEQLWPSRLSKDYLDRWNPFLRIILEFHRNGYLARFLPYIPNYRRLHYDSLTTTLKAEGLATLEFYVSEIEAYSGALLSGKCRHVFRNGTGKVIDTLEDKQLEWLGLMIADYRQTEPIHGPHNLL